MLIRATKTGTTKDGSPRMTHRLVENSRYGQSVKPMTLPLTTTRCACADNATLHVRTTATPDVIQTNILSGHGTITTANECTQSQSFDRELMR